VYFGIICCLLPPDSSRSRFCCSFESAHHAAGFAVKSSSDYRTRVTFDTQFKCISDSAYCSWMTREAERAIEGAPLMLQPYTQPSNHKNFQLKHKPQTSKPSAADTMEEWTEKYVLSHQRLRAAAAAAAAAAGPREDGVKVLVDKLMDQGWCVAHVFQTSHVTRHTSQVPLRFNRVALYQQHHV